MADWFDGDTEETIDASFKDYNISATPNDFNLKTLVDFIDSGLIKIPSFQRNYVWDLARASRLIESLLIGLPIPQMFFYEEARNSFLVVDGQQRLMTIFYFMKGRFPKRNKRLELRRIFALEKTVPLHILADDRYFDKFNLELLGPASQQISRFHGKNYDTLEDHKTTFNLSTIRSIVIKQTSPTDDGSSAVFEIFNRLNTGGINLTAQEIRASLYHSEFMRVLDEATYDPRWLAITNRSTPDINMKDTEIMLRSFAMLAEGEKYYEPMGVFLNSFARKGKTFSDKESRYTHDLLNAFLDAYKDYPRSIFSVTARTRFNIAFFECAFRVICEGAFNAKTVKIPRIPVDRFDELRSSSEFVEVTRFATGQRSNVNARYDIAKRILRP